MNPWQKVLAVALLVAAVVGGAIWVDRLDRAWIPPVEEPIVCPIIQEENSNGR